MGTDIKRKLASIERIQEVKPIPDADAIEAYRVLGWWVVGKKGEHQVGDFVVYIELDTWVPHELAPFLSKGKEPREYDGVLGERLRTVKLRGQVSQGLLLNINDMFYFDDEILLFVTKPKNLVTPYQTLIEGTDITDMFGFQKWDPPLPAQLQGQARGNFPTSLIPKTDQSRIQNCFDDISHDDDYEVTIKLDGSSMTVFKWEGDLRICSRNLELKISDENATNSFVAKALELADQLPEGYAFQGELIGEGIQGNPEKLKGQEFYVFDVFDIQAHSYLLPEARRQLVEKHKLLHVPVLYTNSQAPQSVDDALENADGPSINAKLREGIVYKSNTNPSHSFKAISNKWLLKKGE